MLGGFYMKKIFVGVLALMLLTGCTASKNNDEQTAEISETAETVSETEKVTETVTETEKSESETTTEISAEEEITPFVSEEAENYCNIIMSDTFWRKDNTVGATMLDLQGDGIPEFLVSNDQDDDNVDCYEFGDGKLNYLYSFYWQRSMARYVEDGKTYWWNEDYWGEDDEIKEGEFHFSYRNKIENGLIEFTENGPKMTKVLFSSSEDYDGQTDTYKGEMYIGGEKYADDYIENLYSYERFDDLNYNSWYSKQFDWKAENLSDDENYKLAANSEQWTNDSDINIDVRKLCNAYCTNDKEYLTTPGYFGDAAAFKPVIYLYPETAEKVNVSLDLNGQLTCTYPEYGNGWRVYAKPDGTLYDIRSGGEYSYLFWEASLNAEWDMSEGFVVKGSETADFLREKLSYMGLTVREYNEFIVYWLPLMQNNRYNLISFQTDAYENAARLEITPKPDSILRIFMAFEALDEYEEVPEQELLAFERKGFTIVEWGGTEVNA